MAIQALLRFPRLAEEIGVEPATFRTDARWKALAAALEGVSFFNTDGSAPLVDVAMRAGLDPAWLAGECRASFTTAEHARGWVRSLAEAEADFALQGACERLFRETRGDALVDGLTSALQARQRALGGNGGMVSTEQLALQFITDHEQRIRGGQDGGGLKVGLPELDARTHGGRPGELWVLQGRKGEGKSTFADFIRRGLGEQQIHSALFSGEMLGAQLGERFAHASACLAVEQRLELRHVDFARERVQRGPGRFMLVDERRHGEGLTVDRIDKAVRAAQEHFGELGLVVVDHLGLLRGLGGKDRTERLTYGVLAMKDLAIRRRVWVLLLNHLGRDQGQGYGRREGDQKPYREPTDEEGFGTSEQEKSADALLILWQYVETDKIDNQTRRRTFLKLAKHRQTGRGCVLELVYDPPTQSFLEDGVRRSW